MGRMTKHRNLFVLVSSWFAALTASAAGQGWTLIDLDPAGLTRRAWVSERAGDQIAGWGYWWWGGTFFSPLQWNASGLSQLPVLPGHDEGIASGINRAGTAVGLSSKSGVPDSAVAVMWTGGSVIDLNSTVTGGDPLTLTLASDIDELGRIVGSGDNASGERRAFLMVNGIVTDLGTPASHSDAGATRLASAGRVVGTGDSILHALMWDGLQAFDLHDPAFGHSRSSCENGDRLGKVCGNAWDTTSAGFDAYVWDHGTITMLTDPGDDLEVSVAESMNDFGVVSGEAYSATLFGAFTWRQGVSTDLNSLLPTGSGWWLMRASFVDDDGSVVGQGTYNGVSERPFLLLPPPTHGTFSPYGRGCAGSSGLEPTLNGVGVPSPERDLAMLIQDALPSALGFLILGTGTNVARVTPVCDVQVLPLLPPLVPILADPFGELFLPAFLPPGTPAFDLNFQALFFDPGAPFGISSSAALAVHFE